MEIGERIKKIRTDFNLNQTEFGERIGIGQAAVSALEKGIRDITDRNILLICENFNVNEEWLRYEKGPIYIKTDDSLLAKLATEYKLSTMEHKILSVYLQLEESRRNQLIDFIKCFTGELSKTGLFEEIAASDENYIDQEVNNYRLELEAAKNEKKLSVSARPEEDLG